MTYKIYRNLYIFFHIIYLFSNCKISITELFNAIYRLTYIYKLNFKTRVHVRYSYLLPSIHISQFFVNVQWFLVGFFLCFGALPFSNSNRKSSVKTRIVDFEGGRNKKLQIKFQKYWIFTIIEKTCREPLFQV